MTRPIHAVWLAVAALLFAAFPPGTAAQGLTDCGCEDVREMHDRWCSARAARSEYERIKSVLETQAVKAGERRMFSNADKNMINQVCVKEAIDRTSDQGVGKATAVTNENMPLEFRGDDCRVAVTSEKHTNCQKQIVEAHEGLHRLACLARKERFKDMNIDVRTRIQTLIFGAANMAALNLTGDSKYMMTSANFASEEAASYAMEAQLIFARWKDLQQLCESIAFEILIEPQDASQVGQQFWDSITPDPNNGKKYYQMYDLSNSRCPNHPRPSPSQCTIK